LRADAAIIISAAIATSSLNSGILFAVMKGDTKYEKTLIDYFYSLPLHGPLLVQ
jgi:hypothetical protein